MVNHLHRTAEEREEWERQDPEEREKEYLPQKYSSLRKVPAYERLVNERFERSMVRTYTFIAQGPSWTNKCG